MSLLELMVQIQVDRVRQFGIVSSIKITKSYFK